MNKITTKKAVLCVGAFLLVAICAIMIIVLFKPHANENEYDKYIIVQESIYWGDKAFNRQQSNLASITLGEQIGITDEKQQVYSIEGMDRESWICVRVDGLEYIYTSVEVPALSLENLAVSMIQVKDESSLGGVQARITDTEVINSIVGYIVDENLVIPPESVSVVKQVNLYIEEYPELYYILYYLHNDTDGCFLLNPVTNEAWKIGHELMMQL